MVVVWCGRVGVRPVARRLLRPPRRRGSDPLPLGESGDDDDDDNANANHEEDDGDDDDDDDDDDTTAGGDDGDDDDDDDDDTTAGGDDDDDDDTTTGEPMDDGDPETSSSSGDPVPVPTRIIIFRGPSTNGNIEAAGGMADARASADALCEGAPAYPDDECTNVHALLSFDAQDEIANMEANFGIPDLPVESIDGTLIDHDFRQHDGWHPAGDVGRRGRVHRSDGEFYWTGTWIGGEVNDYNCEEWTSTMGYSIGAQSDFENSWFGSASVACTQNLPILCACW